MIEAKMLMTLGERCLLPGMEQKGSFAMKKCSLPCCGEGYKGMSYVNIHWLVHLRFVHFAVYTLYHNLKKKKGMGLKWEVEATAFMGTFFPHKQTNKQTNKNKWGLGSLTRVADRNLRPILALPTTPSGKSRATLSRTVSNLCWGSRRDRYSLP